MVRAMNLPPLVRARPPRVRDEVFRLNGRQIPRVREYWK
jgi:hypothetical protein